VAGNKVRLSQKYGRRSGAIPESSSRGVKERTRLNRSSDASGEKIFWANLTLGAVIAHVREHLVIWHFL